MHALAVHLAAGLLARLYHLGAGLRHTPKVQEQQSGQYLSHAGAAERVRRQQSGILKDQKWNIQFTACRGEPEIRLATLAASPFITFMNGVNGLTVHNVQSFRYAQVVARFAAVRAVVS